MTHIETLIRNPYANEKVTNIRLAGATYILLPKLIAANTTGQFTIIIAAIQDAYNPFVAKVLEIANDLAFGKGFTHNREQVAADFLAFVRENYITIQALYIHNNAKLLQFYPNGMKDYNKGNKDTWVALMNFYSGAATANHADFPSGFVTDANNFPGKYTTAADEQGTGQQGTGIDRSDRDVLGITLEEEMFVMLHAVIGDARGNLAKINSVIDLKSLEPRPRKQILHINGTFFASKTNTILHEQLDITYVISIKNTGDADIGICLATDAITACGTHIVLRVGKTHTYLAPTLGDLANTYLNFTNLSLSNSGSYEVKIWRE